MDNVKHIYTWKDVDRIFKNFNKNNEYLYFNYVDVYHDEVVVNLNDMSKVDEAKEILGTVLGKNYISENNIIKFDLFDKTMDVLWEEGSEERKNSEVIPLFKDVIYHNNLYKSDIIKNENLKKCPVIAFHSYKGGVGRTLSLLAFAKAWSSNSSQKLLIVDSDIEAPGLTWLMQEEGDQESQISYFDILEMIQCSELEEDTVYDNIVNQMQLQTMKIDNGKVFSEHFFLPTYRYEEQLLDIYTSPESIVKGYNKKYILAEKLSQLGDKLGASAVLVDLRAGISEFSAPLLFDPRVKKYIVSSTSHQSVKGTQLILKEICKGLDITEDSNIPNIFLTMTSAEVDIPSLKGKLLQVYDEQEQSYTDNIVTELPFASELIHLETLNQILSKLEDREMYRNISNIVKEFYIEPLAGDLNNSVDLDRNKMIEKIHDIADHQINAEINSEFSVLMTQPIENLIKRFGASVPQAVVIGAKGAGKTFLFRELLKEKKWENFCKKNGNLKSDNSTYIIPLIAPKNFDEINGIITDAIEQFGRETGLASADTAYWYKNGAKLQKHLSESLDLEEWRSIWEQCIMDGFSQDINISLKSIEKTLSDKNINVMFVVDGLEEVFSNTLDNENEKYAIRALVQDLMNDIKIQYPHIGLLVFLRKDLSNNSFDTNREQFERQNRNYALNWTHDEALKLALWLVNQAVPGFFVEKDVKIESASTELIKKSLEKLWGVKLGKRTSNEAYSYRWILAALSDFNSQLQARDIVRFLADATKEVGTEIYDDRIIMPKEIKNAVQTCSNNKVKEIKEEMKKLETILVKLEEAPEHQKVLPFAAGTFELTAKEEKLMIQEGLLKIDDGKYYIPEIIRHALKFKYEKGARPKVLSLLFK